MKNTKERNNYLMKLADQAIQNTDGLFKNRLNLQIHDSYNGQTAALGVAIAMSGLRPALANYYQDNDKRKVNRCTILDAIAKMISYDNDFRGDFADAKALFKYAIEKDADLDALKREIVDCAIALKQVIRTYELV